MKENKFKVSNKIKKIQNKLKLILFFYLPGIVLFCLILLSISQIQINDVGIKSIDSKSSEITNIGNVEDEIKDNPSSKLEPTDYENSRTDNSFVKEEISKKISKLMIFGIDGYDISDLEREFLSTYQPLGYIFFQRNIALSENGSSNKLNLIRQIELTYDEQTDSDIEILKNLNKPIISIDQEGGIVKRITWDGVGSAKDIASLSDESEKCREWERRDVLLSNLGFNWNFGFVADYTQDENSFIYPRIFSEDLKEIERNLKIAISCTQQNISTAKHYPGHGATDLDTHKGLAVLNDETIEEWEGSDLLPFKVAIEEDIDSIMLGHLVTTFLDDEVPASLSKEHNLYLRNTLNFDGIIITDDLIMLESAGYSLNDAYFKALLAGNDVLLSSISDPIQKEEIIIDLTQRILELDVSEREILLKQVDQSLDRLASITSK